MPRDKRLWMTFPIDFDEHPKIEALSDAAFRAFVSMNGYSRRHDLDGEIPAAVARKRWGVDVLNELVASHQTRPLVYLSLNPDVYVIRDYAEHQDTTAARAERKRIGQANGVKGGRPPKNPAETQLVTDPVTEALFNPDNSRGTQRKGESRVQRTSTKTSESQSRDTRASVSTDAMVIPERLRAQAARRGITSLRTVADAIHRHTTCAVDAYQAYNVAATVLDKAPKAPAAPQRYVTAAIAKNPAEIEQLIYGAVA